MNGDIQKESVNGRITLHEGNLDRALKGYAAGEGEKYRVDTTSAWLTSKADAVAGGYANSENYIFGRAEIKAVLKDFYKGNPAAAEVAYRKLSDKIAADGIENLLTNGQDILAKQLYRERKGDISVDVRNRIEKAMEEGVLRGESQRISDGLAAKDISITDALKEMKSIKDPQLRDEVEKRVKQYYHDKTAAEKADIESRYLNAVNLHEQNPGKTPRDVVPPSDWVRFSITERNALEQRGEAGKNDDRAWVDFIALGSEKIAALSRAEFETKYWTKFDNGHRGRAETLWLAAREADEKAEQFTAIISPVSITESTWQSLGLGKPADNAEAFSVFEQEVQRQVNLYEVTALGGKRKASPEELRKITGDVAMKNIIADVDLSWWPTGVTAVQLGERKPKQEIESFSVRKVERTGLYNGRKVIQYSDGSVEYAD